MQLTNNFTLEEMVASATARRHSLANEPNERQTDNLRQLCTHILQPLRDAYGKPIHVTSGYRCPELNQLLYGARNSQHMDGLAADITVLSPSGNKALFKLIQKLNLPFDQLIEEYGYQWLHVSYSPQPRKLVLHKR